MSKGLLILFGTFVVIGVIHFISMKMVRISEAKKLHYRKVFWYLYAALLILTAVVNLVEGGILHWSFLTQFLLGLTILILNFLGKIEAKNSESR